MSVLIDRYTSKILTTYKKKFFSDHCDNDKQFSTNQLYKGYFAE